MWISFVIGFCVGLFLYPKLPYKVRRSIEVLW